MLDEQIQMGGFLQGAVRLEDQYDDLDALVTELGADGLLEIPRHVPDKIRGDAEKVVGHLVYRKFGVKCHADEND